MTKQRLLLTALVVSILVAGCSSGSSPSPTKAPPPAGKVKALEKDLLSWGEGRWSSVTVNVTPANKIEVYIRVMAGANSVALNNYCGVIKGAVADAGLTAYRLDASLKPADGPKQTCD